MFEHSEIWSEYFAELEPVRRLELLEQWEALSSGEEVRFARLLFQERYSDPKHPGRQVDNWLWKCVYLPGMFRRRPSKKAYLREIEQSLKELHLDQVEAAGKEARDVLRLEFMNMARRYLSTCASENYGSSWFGLKKANAEQKKEKAAKDIWMMSRGLAVTSGKEAEMRLFCEALEEELRAYFPYYRPVYDEMEKQYRSAKS